MNVFAMEWRAAQVRDVEDEAEFPDQWLVMAGEFFVCSVHSNCPGDDSDGEQIARRIVSTHNSTLHLYK